MNYKLFFTFWWITLLTGAFLMLIGGIGSYGMNPNRLVYEFKSTDGLPRTNPNTPAVFGNAGSLTFGSMFSCLAIQNNFIRNATQEPTKTCRIVQEETSYDLNNDGVFGDSNGFVYPLKPEKLVCDQTFGAESQVCLATTLGGACTYVTNDVVAKAVYDACLFGQPFSNIFAVIPVSTLILTFSWFLWLRNKNSAYAYSLYVSLCLISILVFFLVLYAHSLFILFNPSSSAKLSFNDCKHMRQESFFASNRFPTKTCFVSGDGSCDPQDYSGPAFFSNTEVGQCTYTSDYMADLNCAAHTAQDVSGFSAGACTSGLCYTTSSPVGTNAESACCKSRRDCCGPDGICSSTNMCDFNTANFQCENKVTRDSTKCNAEQQAAFDANLLGFGKCVSTYLEVTTGETVGGSTKRCNANQRNRYITAAKSINSADPDFPEISESTVPRCLVQTIFDCESNCFGSPSLGCTSISPYEGAPGNCIFSSDSNLCIPDPQFYDSDDASKPKRPLEYCESRMQSASATTNRDSCLSSPDCQWDGTNCRAKSCPGSTVEFMGYQRNNNKKCIPMDKNVAPQHSTELKLCQYPIDENDKELCTLQQETGFCNVVIDVANGQPTSLPTFYWNPASTGGADMGFVNDFFVCQSLDASSCNTNPSCRLVKGDSGLVCRFLYDKCTGNVEAWYNDQVGISNYVSYQGGSCLRDIDGNWRSALLRDLFRFYQSWRTGVILVSVSLAFLCVVGNFTRQEDDSVETSKGTGESFFAKFKFPSMSLSKRAKNSPVMPSSSMPTAKPVDTGVVDKVEDDFS